MELLAGLQQSQLLSRLPLPALEELAARAALLDLRGGCELFVAGERSDSLYIVLTGRLLVLLGAGRAPVEVGAGELLGEIGVLTGEPRLATVAAMRDSVLMRIEGADLLRTLERHGDALLSFTRLIVERLRQPEQEELGGARTVRTVAVVSAVPELDAAPFAAQLHQALASVAPTRLLCRDAVYRELGIGDAAAAIDHTAVVDWLNRQEREARYLVYDAGSRDGPWARRCLRQADRILLLVPAGLPPSRPPLLDAVPAAALRSPIELGFVAFAQSGRSLAMQWREHAGAVAHHWLDADDDGPAMARLARHLTGRAVGLVLGGGGARGFAHIGLLQALEARGMQVDLVGGTSMGAFIGALFASGRSAAEVVEAARDAFVHCNLLNDYTWPRYALIRGRKFMRHMQALFGDASIEALPLPFFCVSTNLTQGAAVVHDAGPLALWVPTSMSVPGVAPPMVWRGELLSDGAVVNSLPIDVMVERARGPVLASDVSSRGGLALPGVEGPDPEGLARYAGPQRRPGLSDILFRTATLTSDLHATANASRATLYLRMPVNDIGMFEWARLDEAVARGREYAGALLDAHVDTLVPGDATPPSS